MARFSPEALGADQALERVADLGTGLGPVALLAALWPATAYGFALTRVLDRLAGARHTTGLRRRGAALALVGVVPVMILASLPASYAGVTAFGDTAVELVGGFGVGLVFGLGATFVAVTFVYRVFPSSPLDWRSMTHGALLAAAGISVLSVAYAAYLRYGANFERRYGSDALAAVLLLGLWLFRSELGVAHRLPGSPSRRIRPSASRRVGRRCLQGSCAARCLQLPG